MQKRILMAVLDKGAKLVMTDGTVWVTNPDDIGIAILWQPPVMVEVNEKSNDKEFDYTLTNNESNFSITARRRK